MAYQQSHDDFIVSDDPARLDIDVIHHFLRDAYWCRGIPRATVVRAIAGSLNFGLFCPQGSQIGYARSVTDRATFAYIGDVFVLPGHRGRGLGAFLVSALMNHPDHQGIRRFMLATGDAQPLYAAAGFTDTAPATADRPYSYMHKVNPEIYQQ